MRSGGRPTQFAPSHLDMIAAAASAGLREPMADAIDKVSGLGLRHAGPHEFILDVLDADAGAQVLVDARGETIHAARLLVFQDLLAKGVAATVAAYEPLAAAKGKERNEEQREVGSNLPERVPFLLSADGTVKLARIER